MLAETVAFSKLPVSEQCRFVDRVSFLYMERRKVVQSESGVVALSSNDDEFVVSTLQIPVGGIALLALGPGTSITNAALTSCARMGCTVQFTGGGGMPENASIVPLSTTSRWAQAQAAVVSSETEARKVAKQLYKKQFGVDSFAGSITQMRGLEGSLMKRSYATLSKQHGLRGWRRDTAGDDNVNLALNICNGLMYGLSAAAAQALCLNPALGVIHRGNARSLLFDLADLYKVSIILPIAFSLAETKPESVPSEARRRLRTEITRARIMADIMRTLTEIFEPYCPKNEGDRLVGSREEVSGHVNYGIEKNG